MSATTLHAKVAPPRAESPTLRVSGLRKRYAESGFLSRRSHIALDGVSFTLEAGAGRVLSIVGESGSGKTTLARIILRMTAPDAGEVDVAGQTIEGDRRRRIDDWALRRLVQPIFQNPFEAFSLHLPVEDYLVRTATNLGGATSRSEADALVEDALRSVGLNRARIAGKGVRGFSGGELQRISIARALIAKPRLIVADEPVSMVDASLRMTIVNLFHQLSRERDVAFVYITHDLSTAYYLSDVMAIMKDGQLLEFGRPEDIVANPANDYTRALMDAIPTLDKKWKI